MNDLGPSYVEYLELLVEEQTLIKATQGQHTGRRKSGLGSDPCRGAPRVNGAPRDDACLTKRSPELTRPTSPSSRWGGRQHPRAELVRGTAAAGADGVGLPSGCVFRRT